KGSKVGNDARKMQAPMYNTQGLDLLNAGYYKQAADMFLQAVNMDPQTPAYKNNLGMAVMKQGRLLDAMSYFEEVMGLDGTLPQPYKDTGQWYERMKRDIEAQSWFTRAIEKDKDGQL